jgi:RNA polymerase sigma factor (sigma-70 family)
MQPDNELLRQYAQGHSEEAFAELVRRHVNLVYSAALRQVGGDAHLAHDVAQSVFTDLARKAGPLSRRESVSGWLYTSAYFAANKIVRSETRRREREEQFMREPAQDTTPEADWEKLRPTLDAVMHELKETDREAVLLRYFENRAFAEVGAKLNVNENAARMRVERALEKLRALLAKRGITTGTALASVISANAIQTAPGYLAATIASASIAGTGTGALAISKMMIMTKLKIGLGAVVAGSMVIALLVQRQSQETLRAENELLAGQVTQLKTDNADLSNRVFAAGNSQPLADNQMAELLRLRAEVTRLRTAKNPAVTTDSPATNNMNMPETKKMQITLKARFVSVPVGGAQTLAAGWAPAGNAAGLLSENQMDSVKKALRDGTEMHLISEAQVTTLSGRGASVSEIKTVPVNGTNAPIGAILDVMPYYSSDSSIFTLDLAARLNQLIGDPAQPGMRTLQTSDQVTLFPGQTAVLEREIPSGGWLPDPAGASMEPGKLLVFVTPTLVDAYGNRLQSTQSVADEISRNAAMQKMSDAKEGVLALLMFASDNQNQFPTNLEQAMLYLKDDSNESIETNFDMVYSGSVAGITNPATTIVLKEKQDWQTPEGKWMKGYGFADGHSEIHTEPNGDFAEFEKEHIVTPANE